MVSPFWTFLWLTPGALAYSFLSCHFKSFHVTPRHAWSFRISLPSSHAIPCCSISCWGAGHGAAFHFVTEWYLTVWTGQLQHFLRFICAYFMCMSALPTTCMHTTCMQCPWRSEDGIRSPQVALSCHGCAGNQTWVLWKHSQGSTTEPCIFPVAWVYF